jgi:hypothetical protein
MLKLKDVIQELRRHNFEYQTNIIDIKVVNERIIITTEKVENVGYKKESKSITDGIRE